MWKLQQSSLVSQIFVCPGNGGTELSPKVSNVNLLDPSFETIVDWAVTNGVYKGPLFHQESHFLKRKVSDSCHWSFNSTLFLSGTYVFSGGCICKTLVL